MKSRWVTTAVAAALFFSAIAVAGERFVIEAVLVRVNDSVLTVGDFRKRLEVEVAQYPTPPAGEDLRKFALQLFESIVDEMVLLERAREKRIRVEDEMLDRQIEGLREENSLQDDQAFEQALAGALPCLRAGSCLLFDLRVVGRLLLERAGSTTADAQESASDDEVPR